MRSLDQRPRPLPARRYGCPHGRGRPLDAGQRLTLILGSASHGFSQASLRASTGLGARKALGQVRGQAGGLALFVGRQPLEEGAGGIAAGLLADLHQIERVGLFRLARDIPRPVRPDVVLADGTRITQRPPPRDLLSLGAFRGQPVIPLPVP